MLKSALNFAFRAALVLCFVNFALLVWGVAFRPAQIGQFAQEDIGLEINELLYKYGYPFENHTVTTEDGYILELHRIPHGKTSNSSETRPPILIVHGLLGNSIAWLSSGEEKALPYYLAEQGYDVWLPNARGNSYSRKHKTLNPDTDNKQFYEFSWHEIGYYDWPAVIDYVIKKTGHEKIFYSGHSQGSVSFFVMMSERPEYNEKIRLMLALAPVVYTKEIKSLGFTIPAYFQKQFEWINENYVYELLPRIPITTQFANKLCSDGSIFQTACAAIVNVNSGFNNEKINLTRLPLFLSYTPSGSSTKQLLHYTQILNSDIFRQYDFGEEKNIAKYGQTTPPIYNLQNVKVPVAIFYGNNDWLTSERDIAKLETSLPNVVLLHKVSDPNFTHFDFLIHEYARDILYPLIVNIMRKY